MDTYRAYEDSAAIKSGGMPGGSYQIVMVPESDGTGNSMTTCYI